MTIMETKLTALQEAVEALNNAIRNNGNVDAARGVAIKAVNAVNNVLIAERVAVLRGMPTIEMWAEYIDHQFIVGYSAKKNPDTGLYEIIDPEHEDAKNVRVTFFHLNNDKANNLARLPQWNTMYKVFCENLALTMSKAIGEKYIAIHGEIEGLPAQRKAMGEKWQPKEDVEDGFSKRDIEKMLTEVVYAMGVPTELIKKMIYADAEYLKTGLATAKKRTADTTGEIVQSSNLTMEDHLFTTLYHRKNKKPYSWQKPKDTIGEVKKPTNTSRKPEEEGLPAEYLEQAEAGEVITTVMTEEEVAQEAPVKDNGEKPTERKEINKDSAMAKAARKNSKSAEESAEEKPAE